MDAVGSCFRGSSGHLLGVCNFDVRAKRAESCFLDFSRIDESMSGGIRSSIALAIILLARVPDYSISSYSVEFEPGYVSFTSF